MSSVDVACKRESTLSLHYKLFARTYVLDIVLAFVEQKSSTEANVILELKNTWKDLDDIIQTSSERKHNIKILIKCLEQANGRYFC